MGSCNSADLSQRHADKSRRHNYTLIVMKFHNRHDDDAAEVRMLKRDSSLIVEGASCFFSWNSSSWTLSSGLLSMSLEAASFRFGGILAVSTIRTMIFSWLSHLIDYL